MLGSGNIPCGKREREAGRLGGHAEGDVKRRCGEANGNCTVELDSHVTWKTTPVTFDTFLYLLELLHQRRVAGARKPWLKVADIPNDAEIPPDVAMRVIEVSTRTKFGHPDRYQDRVSNLASPPCDRVFQLGVST
jgi:hypothetical protein